MSSLAAQKELKKRQLIYAHLKASLFDKQRAAVEDQSRRKIIWTSRRGGKTTTVIRDFVYQALSKPNSEYYYIALTLQSAQRIAWKAIKELDRFYKLNCKFRRTEFSCIFRNGSKITLLGADKPEWPDRIYGVGQFLHGVAIDEAAFFKTDLETLYEDQLDAALNDNNAVMYLMSVAPRTPVGFFYRLIEDLPDFDHEVPSDKNPQVLVDHIKNSTMRYSGEPSKYRAEWSIHHWTTLDNPHLSESIENRIRQKIEINHEYVSDPDFVRNYLGGKVTDFGLNIYHPSRKMNHLQSYETRVGDYFVLGVDFGWHDKTAFSLCTWNKRDTVLYEIETYAEPEMVMDKIADKIKDFQKRYPGVKIVGDPGRKDFFEQLRRVYQLPMMPALKTNKYHWFELINNDLLAGKIKLVGGWDDNPHVNEMVRLKAKHRQDGTVEEDRNCENDHCDAFLYAYRQASHYRMEEQKEPDPKAGSEKFFKRKEDEIVRNMERMAIRKRY